ncbi:sugar ABC transporter substrate-binding protein [Streptomyces cuspidosporus]|uniref:Sugar ABC transporter substrate-binding protein n=1 Tax=Streptomyces cuspidosporus TaxID=66882 RepID=A0ABN3FAR6_9ACTN
MFRHNTAASTAITLVLLAGASQGCTIKSSDDPGRSGGPGAAAPRAGSGSAELTDGSKVKVALVPGGAHPYFTPWKKAGVQAKEELGLGGVTFDETAEWDQQKQNNLVSTLAARGFNAFGLFGVSPTDINTTFADLKSQGFAVASLGSCPAGRKNEADFCLSTDVELAAYKAAKATIEAMGGKGSLVHLTGANVDANTQRRVRGVEKAVAETGGKVKLLQTITDIDKDLQTAQRAVSDLLAAKGSKIQGIVSTAYNPAVAAADAVRESGSKAKVVAIDDDAKILSSVKNGSVSATVVQNPLGQAEIGIWVLALLESGQCTMAKPGVIVDSGSFVVTKDNVTGYDALRRKKTADLRKQFADSLLSCG